MSSKDLYYAHMKAPKLKAIICAIFGHDSYRTQGWYFYEVGCHRCGTRFLHQFDLFDHPPASRLPQPHISEDM